MLVKREDRTEDSVKKTIQDENQRVCEHFHLQSDHNFNQVFIQTSHILSPGKELRPLGENQGGS